MTEYFRGSNESSYYKCTDLFRRNLLNDNNKFCIENFKYNFSCKYLSCCYCRLMVISDALSFKIDMLL